MRQPHSGRVGVAYLIELAYLAMLTSFIMGVIFIGAFGSDMYNMDINVHTCNCRIVAGWLYATQFWDLKAVA